MADKPNPRGGWPIREEPLAVQMHLRLSERMHAHVQRLAKAQMVTRGEAVRRIVTQHMEEKR